MTCFWLEPATTKPQIGVPAVPPRATRAEMFTSRADGGSAAASWMLNNRGPRMVQDNPEVTSAVDIFVKDLSIVMDAGRAAKAALPVAAAARP